MEIFDPLLNELDQWNFNGEEATLWWRDDDAQQTSPALDRMLGLSDRFNLPLSIAVIPDGMESSLALSLSSHSQVSVLQHGFSHHNFADPDEKKQELGLHRDINEVMVQLQNGFDIIQKSFVEKFVPIMVPPWNRIVEPVQRSLPEIGIMGLSTYGPRINPEPVEGMWQINTHVDIVDWKNEKKFAGAISVIDSLVRHLSGKRSGEYDAAEPTGLLTHHLVHHENSWLFLAQLFELMDDHPAVTWLSAEKVFQTNWR